MDYYKNCTLCPRRCGANRYIAEGRCKSPAEIRAARAAPHFGEEPCISGSGGSGAVFFSGCSLGCVFCQNQELSKNAVGKAVSPKELSDIFRRLEAQGVHNINLVTPTHFVPSIIEALEHYRPKIPVVYNCGGYESPETLDMLKGYIDIYLTDIKYFSGEISKKYSGAEDYFGLSFRAAEKMIQQSGAPVLDEKGIMQKGVIIRHLCLPSHRKDSIAVMNELKRLPPKSFILSLMSQYTPWGDLSRFPEINRRITAFEYKSVISAAQELDLFMGYTQERSSAKTEYTPKFDLTGLEGI